MKKYLLLLAIIFAFLFSFPFGAKAIECNPPCSKGYICTDLGYGASQCEIDVRQNVGEPCTNSTNCVQGKTCLKINGNCSCQKNGTAGEECKEQFLTTKCASDSACPKGLKCIDMECQTDPKAVAPVSPSTPSVECPGGACSFSNPLKYDTVEGLATNLLSTLRTIIVVLSIIFIVLGGIFYILSAGSEKMMKLAKGSITASMIGLAIGIAAPSFLKEIYTILGGTSGGSGITPPAGLSLSQIATNFLNFLLAIIGILALIMLIIGGITFLTSAGDDDRYKTGKKIVTYAVIGIAVSLASLVIVKQIASLLK